MLLVDTYLDKSPIHGIGVFAAEFVAKDRIMWVFNPVIDKIIRKDEIADLPKHMQAWIWKVAWQDLDGHFRLGIDNDKFINHSSDPNSGFFREPYVWLALRDIQIGEEILDNYTEFSESDYAKGLKGDSYLSE